MSNISNINMFLFFFWGVNIFFLINSLIQFSSIEYFFDNSFDVPEKDSNLDAPSLFTTYVSEDDNSK